MKKKILIQVNCSYDLYNYLALINNNFNNYEITLLAPKTLIKKTNKNLISKFFKVIDYNHKLKNLFSFVHLISSIRLSIWCFINKNYFETIFVGAYRNEVSSILAKHFYKNAKLIAIKQGIDISDDKYKKFNNLSTFHDFIYFKIFGFSSFSRARLKPLSKNTIKTDFFFSILKWQKDPFDKKNIYTIGTKKAHLKDGTKLILPNFKILKKNHCTNNSSIFIIGERTPMTPYWDDKQNIIFKKILLKIKKINPKYKIFLRPRVGLTNIDFYNYLEPTILDPNQLFDEQLINLNPNLVFSVKSTASKVAAYYGYNSILLYKCLDLNNKELLHLDHLFADGSPIHIVENILKLESQINYFSQKNSLKDIKYFNFHEFF